MVRGGMPAHSGGRSFSSFACWKAGVGPGGGLGLRLLLDVLLLELGVPDAAGVAGGGRGHGERLRVVNFDVVDAALVDGAHVEAGVAAVADERLTVAVVHGG